MNGIEKITQQIGAEAEAEVQRILVEARAQADAIAAEYDRKLEKTVAEAKERGKAAAAQREERLISVTGMESRKAALAAKQEMVGRAFDLAMEKLCALPDENYVELLAGLAVKAASTGREQVVLSAKDRARVGKAVVMRANEILAKSVAPQMPRELSETKPGAFLEKVVTGASALLAGTGMLTLSERTAPILGGLILVDGDVEVNCTFETLIRLAKNDISGEVAKVLFE